MRQDTGGFGDARTDKSLASRRGVKGERMAGIGKDSENTKRRKRKKAVCLAQTAFCMLFLGEVFGENGVKMGHKMVGKPAYRAAKPLSKSARISSMCSVPMDSRMVFC